MVKASLIQHKEISATGSPVTQVNITLDEPVSYRNKIIVLATGNGYEDIGYQSPMTISDNQSNTYVAPSSNRSYSDINHYVWYSDASTNGVLTITIDIGGTGDDSCSFVVMEWNGLGELDVSNNTSNWQYSSNSATVTTTTDHTLILALCSDQKTVDPSTYIEGPGYTAVGGSGGGNSFSWVEYKEETISGTYTPTLTPYSNGGSHIRTTLAFEVVQPITGNGLPEDPYILYLTNHLNDISLNTSSHYKLNNDIDANGLSYSIPQDFSGTFDGNGKIIRNLYIPFAGNQTGFIGKMATGGVIKNLGIEDANVSGGLYTGIVTGWVVSGSKVEASYSTGVVNGSSIQVGGLVGFNQGGTVINCYNEATVNGDGTTRIAGLVGRGGGAVNCYSIGPVNTNNEATYTGAGLTSEGTSTGCYWDMEASGETFSYSGTGLTTAQAKTQSSYVGWNFTDIWTMPPGDYPRLKVFLATPPTEEPEIIDSGELTLLSSGTLTVGADIIIHPTTVYGDSYLSSSSILAVSAEAITHPTAIYGSSSISAYSILEVNSSIAISRSFILRGEGRTLVGGYKEIYGELSLSSDGSLEVDSIQIVSSDSLEIYGVSEIISQGLVISNGSLNLSSNSSLSVSGTLGIIITEINGSALIGGVGAITLTDSVIKGASLPLEGSSSIEGKGSILISIEPLTVIAQGTTHIIPSKTLSITVAIESTGSISSEELRVVKSTSSLSAKGLLEVDSEIVRNNVELSAISDIEVSGITIKNSYSNLQGTTALSTNANIILRGIGTLTTGSQLSLEGILIKSSTVNPKGQSTLVVSYDIIATERADLFAQGNLSASGNLVISIVTTIRGWGYTQVITGIPPVQKPQSLINTVHVESNPRLADPEEISRLVEEGLLLRETDVGEVQRVVEVTMTYTLEEWYFAGPFHLVDSYEEGPLWSTE
jgi:hypothetical protein